jgi:hypothetical protein
LLNSSPATARGLEAILPIPLEDPVIVAPLPEFAGRHWRDRFIIAGNVLRKIAAVRDDSAL